MYFFTHFGLHWNHFNWSLIHEALATIQALVKDDQNFEILIRKKCQSLSNMIMSRMWPDQEPQIHRCEALLKPHALSPWLGIVFEQLRMYYPCTLPWMAKGENPEFIDQCYITSECLKTLRKKLLEQVSINLSSKLKCVTRACSRTQRLEYWGAFRALSRPYFFLSTFRESRVRSPCFLSGSRFAWLATISARAIPNKIAWAWADNPPPSVLTMTSYLLS